MVLICPRVHLFEINDQPWFPQYLREKVQSCLTLAWTFRVPVIQDASPAELVSRTLYQTLAAKVQDYTYIDFCAGAGGPTPFIEKDLNSQLLHQSVTRPQCPAKNANDGAVKFVLTDIHPHIHDWAKASKRSANLSFVSVPVDASRAPANLTCQDGKKVFRLYNLAFHHFDDKLGANILQNTLETADGFGIFELQERTVSSLLTVCAMGLLFFFITPFFFWRSPGHLFFTYVIPIIPFVLVFDGYVSSLRTRSADEVQALMKATDASTDNWNIKYGAEQHTWPTGYMTWTIGIKE